MICSRVYLFEHHFVICVVTYYEVDSIHPVVPCHAHAAISGLGRSRDIRTGVPRQKIAIICFPSLWALLLAAAVVVGLTVKIKLTNVPDCSPLSLFSLLQHAPSSHLPHREVTSLHMHTLSL